MPTGRYEDIMPGAWHLVAGCSRRDDGSGWLYGVPWKQTSTKKFLLTAENLEEALRLAYREKESRGGTALMIVNHQANARAVGSFIMSYKGQVPRVMIDANIHPESWGVYVFIPERGTRE